MPIKAPGKRSKHKPRVPSLRTLKRRLDAVFSLYIRHRDAGPNGLGACVTCRKLTLLEASHFIPRQYLAVRWDERNVHGSCSYCNRWLHGNLVEYYEFMLNRYGPEVIAELQRKKRETVKMSRADYEDKIRYFSEK